MAKQQKKSRSGSGASASSSTMRKVAINLLAIGTIAAAGGYGYLRLERYARQALVQPAGIPAVVLKSRPVWMRDVLAEQITDSVRPKAIVSAMDSGVLRQIEATLSKNAWIKKVNSVRRLYNHSAGDTIELDCEFRNPRALVQAGGQYILVDDDGVRLPVSAPSSQPPQMMFSSDGLVNLRIIQGVAGRPPEKDGAAWAGDDLRAGLDLVRMLYGRPVAEEIHAVDVSNYQGRVKRADPQLVLVTRYGTNILWGEPVRATFFAELPPDRKLERLGRIRQQYGRVDMGKPWIDIRLDTGYYPEEATTTGG